MHYDVSALDTTFENSMPKAEMAQNEKFLLLLNPFPHMTILQQTTLNVFCQNIENLHNRMDYSGKHCGKRRNCTFCAISSFVTMFSKSRLPS